VAINLLVIVGGPFDPAAESRAALSLGTMLLKSPRHHPMAVGCGRCHSDLHHTHEQRVRKRDTVAVPLVHDPLSASHHRLDLNLGK
jgi:hypothetical protein